MTMRTPIAAVSPNEESTWLVPVWLVPLPGGLSTGPAVIRGAADTVPTVTSARHCPSWQVALVRRVLRASTRRTRRKRKMSDRDTGKDDIGRGPIVAPRRRRIPIPREIRIT